MIIFFIVANKSTRSIIRESLSTEYLNNKLYLSYIIYYISYSIYYILYIIYYILYIIYYILYIIYYISYETYIEMKLINQLNKSFLVIEWSSLLLVNFLL